MEFYLLSLETKGTFQKHMKYKKAYNGVGTLILSDFPSGKD